MTRDQLEELVKRLEHGAKPERYEDFAAADYRQLCGEATTLLRSLLAQEPVMRLNHEGVPKWLPPEFGGGRLPDTPLYASPVPAVDPEWKTEAMRLADEYADQLGVGMTRGHLASEAIDSARAALAAHLDKLGGK